MVCKKQRRHFPLSNCLCYIKKKRARQAPFYVNLTFLFASFGSAIHQDFLRKKLEEFCLKGHALGAVCRAKSMTQLSGRLPSGPLIAFSTLSTLSTGFPQKVAQMVLCILLHFQQFNNLSTKLSTSKLTIKYRSTDKNS